MARILLGVSGGISAYKAVELVRLAMRAGHSVRVVQTRASLRFVGRATFEAISGAPVLVDEFDPDPARGAYPGDAPPAHAPISHLALVDGCDVYAVVPASANTIAKLAAGLADNLLTSAALAAAAPLVIAPAMNERMWRHPATRANVETLVARGATIVPPATGRLASRGEWGEGRLAEPSDVLAAIDRVLDGRAPAAIDAGSRERNGTGERTPKGLDTAAHDRDEGSIAPGDRTLERLRVVVSAGGTREPIDAVRYVGNRSSGRMGFALAAEALRRGAEVTVVAANVDLPRERGIDYVDVETAAELEREVLAASEGADVVLMAAAVADFRPAAPERSKLSKAGHERLTLELEPTSDVLAELGQRRRPRQVLVGFAAEHGEGGLARAREKLRRKRVDAIVLNDVARSDIGFDVDANEVTIVTADGDRPVARASKAEIARALLDVVEQLGSAEPLANGPAPAATTEARG